MATRRELVQNSNCIVSNKFLYSILYIFHLICNMLLIKGATSLLVV